MAGKIVDVTLRLVDHITAPMNRVGASITKNAWQIERNGKTIQRAGRNIAGVGMSLTKSLTVPIAGLGTVATKLASDFEAGMSAVQAISGSVAEKELPALEKKAKEMGIAFQEGATATETAMNILGSQAKKMGAQTKFSAKEATQAYQYMAMAGWKAGDMMEGISGIMYLAGATGEDLALTSDIVTDALTAFGMTAKDTTKFVDVLAKTASNSNTNVAMLGESFTYCAPVAGALGYSVEDVSTALGLMANSGIKASVAGTALRSWMSNMAAPTKNVNNALSKLGISLTDSKGNMKSLANVMGETKLAFSNLTESEKAMYAKALAGKQGMSGLLAVVNSSDKDFNKLSDAIYNSAGACKEMYDVANDNLAGQLTILKSTAESLAISFGERLAPYVKKMVGYLQKLADKFNSLSVEQQDMIIKTLAIVAAIGPAIFIFGKLVTSVGSVVTIFGKVGKAFKKFETIAGMLKSPVGIAIMVVTALAASAFLIIKNWSKIKPFLGNVKKWFLETFGGVGGALDKFKQGFAILSETLSPIIAKMKKGIKQFAAGTGKAFEKLKPILKKYFISEINRAAKRFLTFAKIVKKVIPVISKGLKKAFEYIVPVLKTVGKVIKSVSKVLGKDLKERIKAMSPVLKKLGNLFGIIFKKSAFRVKTFLNVISPIVKKIIKVVMSIFEKTKPAFQVAFIIFGETIKSFSNIITKIFKGIMGVIGGLIDFITGVFTGDWEKAWQGVKSIFASIFDTLAALVKKPINAVISIINQAINALNRVKVDIPDWVPGMGGKTFGLSIPTIPALAVGTNNWKGGIAQVSEKGGEIIDLPQGSRVYPHDESVNKAYQEGRKSGGNNITITIPKLAETITVRSDADIDKIAQKLADKLEKVSQNIGGGDIGYIY